MVLECDAFVSLTSTNNNKRSYLFKIYVITLSDTKYVIIAIVKKNKKKHINLFYARKFQLIKKRNNCGLIKTNN